MTVTPENILYTWAIASLERHTFDGIVYMVHWTVAAFAEGANASAYGSIGLEPPSEGDPVIPYNDLTSEIVVGWVKDKFGEEQVASIEKSLAAQIAEQLAPSTASGLPW
jgi:hypothetical protein